MLLATALWGPNLSAAIFFNYFVVGQKNSTGISKIDYESCNIENNRMVEINIINDQDIINNKYSFFLCALSAIKKNFVLTYVSTYICQHARYKEKVHAKSLYFLV